MHPDHSVSSNIFAANRRHDLHPFPVRQPAQSSNAAQFTASLAVPRKVTVSAPTAQCHGHSNLKAPELLERLSSASQMLFGTLLSNFFVKSVLTMLVRAATKLSPASYLPPLEKIGRPRVDLMWRSSSSFPRTVGQRTPSPVPILGGQVAAVVNRYRPYSFPRPHCTMLIVLNNHYDERKVLIEMM
jgi:hypothetical protein